MGHQQSGLRRSDQDDLDRLPDEEERSQVMDTSEHRTPEEAMEFVEERFRLNQEGERRVEQLSRQKGQVDQEQERTSVLELERRARVREQRRIQQQNRRARLLAMMTPEQAAEERAHNSNLRQLRRKNTSDDVRENARERNTLGRKIIRQNLPHDARAEIRQLNTVVHREQRANLPDPRRAEIQQRNTSVHRTRDQSQTLHERAIQNSVRRENIAIRLAARRNLNLDVVPPDHYLGPLSDECSHCGAMYFRNEHPHKADGTYNPCCGNGAVTLDRFEQYPIVLAELFTGQNPHSANFIKNIRKFNSAFSIASMDCKLQTMQGRGPFVFKIHGEICFHTGPAVGNNVAPSYGQLFFIDETAAADHRIAYPANSDCNPDLMRFLSRYMRENHEYARTYKLLQEVYEEEEEKARQEHREMDRVRLVFQSVNTPDPRRYNTPRIAEVALIYVGKNGEVPSPKNYTVHARGGGLRKVPLIHKMLDPCSYPFFFIRGDFGYHADRKKQVKKANGAVEQKKMTLKDYYCYYLSIRNTFNPILYRGKLLQQFVCGSWGKTEQCNLEFIRNHQATLRSEYYSDLREFIATDTGGQCGSRILLPATFTSSPRYMMNCYLDAMTITSRYGKPDIFVTFTCNPNWREIQENLYPEQTASDRPDLVERVFRMKSKEMMKDITEGRLFGRVIAFVFTVEWQKRGLPHHIHALFTLHSDDKFRSDDDVDRHIRAELPDFDQEPELFEKVARHMIHRDCGINSPCWNGTGCSKRFPYAFQDRTNMNVSGYPVYKRRDTGTIARIGSRDRPKYYNNQWVVPYNPLLLLKYDAHINVQACAEIEGVKYLYKYTYKGGDKAKLKLERKQRTTNGEMIDEVAEHLDARYLCAPEGYHRLFEFQLHGRSNAVVDLVVHEKGKHSVVFVPGNEAQAAEQNINTSLLAYFDFNKKARDFEAEGRLRELGPVDPRTVTYNQFPEHFTYNKKDRFWAPKRNANNNIGRIHSVSPKQQERYCIRLLLLHTTGATSYEELFTINGTRFQTAEEAAKELGLIRTPHHFNEAMADAAHFKMPPALRSVFATLLAFDQPSCGNQMWEDWKVQMSEDYVNRGRTIADAEALAYYDILEMCGPLNIVLEQFIQTRYAQPAPMADDTPDYGTMGQEMYAKVKNNRQQKEAVDAVLSGRERLVLLDGPGGSGKTFCYETIFNILRGEGKTVMCTAWTGIAANLLPEGRTIASFFKLNIAQNCESSSLKPNTREGRLLRDLDVLIIDECSMLSDKVLNTIDTVLRDVTNQLNVPFGGKTVLMGGDFRQVLPIPNKLFSLDAYACCMKHSPLFSEFSRFRLHENMRASSESNEFKEFLLKVGEDKIEKNEEGKIEIPREILSTGDLVEEIFEGIYDDSDHLNARAILCPKNVNVDQMNLRILNKMTGQKSVFLSFDSVEKEDTQDQWALSPEFLNSLTPSSLPPHKLELRIGCIVMLIRNLNVARGLCNGTRLQVEGFGRNALQCKFINGSRKGQSIIIPRIDLKSSKGKDLSFILIRRQFPVKLAFAMTINKSQGQSLEKVGVFLPTEVFSHGQLYVALSRAKNKRGLKIRVNGGETRTTNVVDSRVLQ